jgi:hypothetical protein
MLPRTAAAGMPVPPVQRLKRARRVRIGCSVVASLLAGAGCAGHHVAPVSGSAPSMLAGEYRDDYRGRFSISDSIWFQRPRNRFRIVEWHNDAQFLIAHNAADDPTAPNLWTRIDWISFTDQQPYTWGFCLTAYNAPTREAARATPPAQRATPRTGCNGFPFTRMQRAAANDSAAAR